MTEFAYIATDGHNASLSGKVEAPDRATAISELTKKKLRPLSVRDTSIRPKGDIPLPKFLQPSKVKIDYLVTFTRQLATMVGAGVPLLRALESLQEHGESELLKKVVSEIYHDIQGGMALADALGKHPKIFNDIYVNMVRAGETAGILDDILKRLAVQQEKSSSIKKKIKSAMTYPIVLVIIAVGAFFGLMTFVIPQIANVIYGLAGPNAKLPAITQVMLDISHFFVTKWFIVFPLIFIVIFGLIRFLRTKQGRSLFHHLVLKVPGINVLITKVAVARFARTFSALMGAGVSVIESLQVTARGLGNEVFEDALNEAVDAVKGGTQLSTVIGKNPIFPPIVAQMLSVGEETGQTDQVLVKVADFYDEEVDVAIDGMSSIIEPVMIVFMGGMVGIIAVSVILPIMNMSSYVKD